MFTEVPRKVNMLEHLIDTSDARPMRFNPMPLSVHKRTLLDRVLQEMVDTGAARPSKTLGFCRQAGGPVTNIQMGAI